MEYFQELWETFSEQPLKIAFTAFLIWAILPVIVFAFGGVLLLFHLLSLERFALLWINTILPWWTSIVINFWKFLGEYLLVFIVTLILVNHEIIETINFEELIERLKKF